MRHTHTAALLCAERTGPTCAMPDISGLSEAPREHVTPVTHVTGQVACPPPLGLVLCVLYVLGTLRTYGGAAVEGQPARDGSLKYIEHIERIEQTGVILGGGASSDNALGQVQGVKRSSAPVRFSNVANKHRGLVLPFDLIPTYRDGAAEPEDY